MPNRDDIIGSVLRALDPGFGVFPLEEGGKRPIFPGGCHNATRSREHVIRHWKRYPRHNYGIATGKPSGIFVVDIDGLKGAVSLQALCARYGPLPPTVTVITANGKHLYFRTGGAVVGNSAGKLGPGLDVRGDGGYVVGAGSVHSSGHVYRYADELDPASIPIATAPRWLIELVKKPTTATPAAPAQMASKSKRDRAYGETALDRENRRLASAPLHQRNNALNRCSFRLGQLVGAGYLGEAEVVTRLTQTALQIGLTPDETERTIRSGINSGRQYPRRKVISAAGSSVAGPPGSDNDPLTAELAKLGCTDTDNAERFVKRCGPRFAYSSGFGWLAWTGKRWEFDTEQRRVLAATETARLIKNETLHLTDTTEKKLRVAHAKHSLSKAALDRMLALAAPMMTVAVAQLDADPWLLNVANGTIDLRTGRLRPHDPRDMITKLAPVEYDPNADAPIFRRFMHRVLNGNRALYRYLQRFCGYSLTGITTEQLFCYVKGPTDNGKSTFVNRFREVLGDYGLHTPTETLMTKTHDNNIPNDLARLKGARMVTAIEAAPGRQLDEARIKAMTGGDPITARFMRSEWFTFTPEFKLWFVANDDPRVRSTDAALWRRIRVIPFDAVIPKDQQDPDLPEKLRAESPGILAWAVRGCLLWRQTGLPTPVAVHSATSSYRKRADHVQRFRRDYVRDEQGVDTPSGQMHQAYTDWCAANHEHPLSVKRFNKQMQDLGYEHTRVKSGSVWRNIRLRQ